MINTDALKEGYTVLKRSSVSPPNEKHVIDAKKINPSDLRYMKLATALSIPISYNLLTASIASAAGVGSFDKMHGAVLTVFDAGVVLVISFAGAAWALGHRSKAIEIFIGCCCGYLLVRHAIEIRDFLKSI